MNVNSVKDDKDKYQDILKQKSNEINQKLSKKLDGVQEEMTRHFTNQEKENDRLQKQIAQLKNEKTLEIVLINRHLFIQAFSPKEKQIIILQKQHLLIEECQ